MYNGLSRCFVLCKRVGSKWVDLEKSLLEKPIYDKAMNMILKNPKILVKVVERIEVIVIENLGKQKETK